MTAPDLATPAGTGRPASAAAQRDLAALAAELNAADAAAGRIPARYLEDDAVLLTVARLLLGALEGREVTGDRA